MDTRLPDDPYFNKQYTKHCKLLRLRGLQPKTIDAYARAMRRMGNYFETPLDQLSADQLLDYFNDLLRYLSWSTVKLDLYGLKFFYTYVHIQVASDHRFRSKVDHLFRSKLDQSFRSKLGH